MFTGKNTMAKRILSCLLAVMMTAGIGLPAGLISGAYAATGDLAFEQPVLVVTGMGIIPGGAYASGNVGFEKSYTLEELQSLGITDERLYSANANGNNRRIYRGIGVDLAGLLGLSGYIVDGESVVSTTAEDGYRGSFTVDSRYYYPNFADDDETMPVAAMLAWRNTRDPGTYPAASDAYPPVPAGFAEEEMFSPDSSSLQLLFGQAMPDQIITNQFNSTVNKLEVGGAITFMPITVLDEAYTRAQILMMPRAEGEYTYFSQSSERTDRVRRPALRPAGRRKRQCRDRI